MTHEERMRSIYDTVGGSSIAAVLGCSRFTNALELSRTMRDLMHRGIVPPETDSPAAWLGKCLEAPARDLMTKAVGATIHSGSIETNVSFPWAHAQIDGWRMREVLGSSQDAPCEIKVPFPGNFNRIRLDGLHDEWVLQVTQQAAITGADEVLVGVCDIRKAEVMVVPVKFDAELWAVMAEAGEAFFESVKRDEDPPTAEVAEDDIVAKALARAKPAASVIISKLDSDEAREAGRVYWEYEAMRDEAKGLIEDAKARLVALMPEGEDVVEVPGCIKFRHKGYPGKRSPDIAKILAQHPDLRDAKKPDKLAEEWHKYGKPYRKFTAYHLRDGAWLGGGESP